MFKLDHLEISGFKSFVDPVSVKFTGNLNSIVGPNGCGKSNVADAVTWVLGERSAKSLRAERMEDVIFNGSRSRKPLGMAEVTLTLNADGSIEQAQDGKLVIGRRLFRSGESTYLINGKTARLKEIKDLLMGTGLGIRAYSVIEQGKIDAILSGKPQERRKLLEEAAGITKYKQRKRIAEIKLEEAVGNLSRIDDIVSEVERSLRSLKRQANAARRYGDRRAEHDDLHRSVLLKRWSAIRSRLEDLERQIAEQSSTEAEVAARLHRGEADLATQRGAVDEQAETFNRLREREADIIATIEGKQEFIKGSRQVLREIAERLESGQGLAKHRREEIARLQELQASYQSIRDSTAFATESAATALDRTEALMSSVEQAVARAEEETGSLRGQLMTSVANVNSHRNELHRLQVESEKGRYRRTHLSDDLAAKKKALLTAREASSEGAGEVEELLQDAATRQEAVDALAQKVERLTSTKSTLDERLDTFGREEAATRQRHQVLSELSLAHSDKRGSIQRLLEEAGHGEAGFLADRLQIPEGWERTLDMYLAEMAEAVVLPADADALEVGHAINSGRGTTRVLVPLDASGTESIDDSDVISSLAEALGLPGALANALPSAYLVESAEAAVRLARRHPGVAFLSGDRLWAQSGVVHIQGEQAEPGALARDQEIERLRNRLGEIESESHAIATERIEVRERLEAAAAERTVAEENLAASRRNLAVAEARRDDLVASERRLALECETLESERSEIDRELTRISASVESTRQRLADAEANHTKLESAFDAAQQAVEASRSERESVRTSGASERGQLELLRERLDSHEKGLERIVDEVATHNAQLAQWAEEKAGLERRQSELGEAIAVAEGELQKALEGRSSSEEERRAQQERLQASRSAQQALEETVASERRELEAIREVVGELRVREAGVRQDSEHVAHDYEEHFGEAPPEEFEVPEQPLDELEIDFERMKQLLHRMGPINELAAEEYDEQEERHEFLTSQRQDVQASIERLRQTIAEINETSSERFRKTFEEVNESLGTTFTKLFNGGEAEMRLQDEEDVLESGIEIVARPPGKRLQNLMLLSGGEKALTALALLFALFQTKPSPFCILDEVDAPLDDVNTLRFVGLLKQMAADTQFVVITHNKLTMSAASALYGVTMEERGVSRIVSVELDKIHPEEQAASA